MAKEVGKILAAPSMGKPRNNYAVSEIEREQICAKEKLILKNDVHMNVFKVFRILLKLD